MRDIRREVFSVLLFGVATRVLNDSIAKKLEAFELWLHRRTLKIPWTAWITNVEVLGGMNGDIELVDTIKIKKRAPVSRTRNEK